MYSIMLPVASSDSSARLKSEVPLLRRMEEDLQIRGAIPAVLQKESWAGSPRAQTGQLLGTGNGAILGTATDN